MYPFEEEGGGGVVRMLEAPLGCKSERDKGARILALDRVRIPPRLSQQAHPGQPTTKHVYIVVIKKKVYSLGGHLCIFFF
jgi:hypothetical protein